MPANRTSDLTVLSIERQLSGRIMKDSFSTKTAFAHMRIKATNSARIGWLRDTSDSTLTLNSHPSTRLKTGERCFSFAGPSARNSLPECLQDIRDTQTQP